MAAKRVCGRDKPPQLCCAALVLEAGSHGPLHGPHTIFVSDSHTSHAQPTDRCSLVWRKCEVALGWEQAPKVRWEPVGQWLSLLLAAARSLTRMLCTH